MELASFRGFSPIPAPCLFVNPIDSSFIYPYAKFVVLETPNGNQQFLRGHKRNITCMDMSPKGRMVATGEDEIYSDVIVWDYNRKSVLYTLSEHDGGITCLAFSLDERLLATCGKDKRMIIWEGT